MTDCRDTAAVYRTRISNKPGRPTVVLPAVPLSALRAARNLTLKQLEATTGINAAIWSQLERGLLTPQPKHLAALANAFDVPLASWRVRFILETEGATL